MVDFTTYQPPGVYVEDTTGPVVTATGGPLPMVAVVGPARGYQKVTEAVVLRVDDTSLQNQGVWLDPDAVGVPAGVEAVVVTDVGGNTLADTADYVLTVDTSTGTGPEASLLIKLGGPLTDGATAGGVQDGSVVFVTYYYTDGAYYEPTVFDDFDLIVETYGEPLLTTRPTILSTNQVTSPLALGARLALDNGATSVICVPINPTSGVLRQQYVDAYAKIAANYNAAVVVPIFDGLSGAAAEATNLAEDLRTAIVAASNQGYGRIGIFGVPANYGAGDPQAPGVESIALQVNHKRVIVAYPNRLNLYNGALNLTAEVDGSFFAAACGGALVSAGVQHGLTRRTIAGFAGLPASVSKLQTRSFKDNLSKNGVLVAEVDRQGRFIVRHGLSTDTSSVLTREVSITRARDYLFEALQIGLDNSGLIGSPITSETVIRVKGAIEGILVSAQSRGVFIAYSDIAVRQQALPNGDPSIIEAKFAYQPSVPLNYIKVSFSIDLSSGLVNLAAA